MRDYIVGGGRDEWFNPSLRWIRRRRSVSACPTLVLVINGRRDLYQPNVAVIVSSLLRNIIAPALIICFSSFTENYSTCCLLFLPFFRIKRIISVYRRTVDKNTERNSDRRHCREQRLHRKLTGGNCNLKNRDTDQTTQNN